MAERETWTTAQACEFWNPDGITPASFRKWMSDLGIEPVGREPGRSGQNLWDVAQIREAKDGRPGQGKGGGRPKGYSPGPRKKESMKVTITAGTIEIPADFPRYPTNVQADTIMDAITTALDDGAKYGA